MGEARRRGMLGQMPGQNGHAHPPVPTVKPVRVVPNIRVQNNDADGVAMLMLGDAEPEIAAPLDPASLRKLAAGLLHHAEALEALKRPLRAAPPPRPMLFGPGGYPLSEAERAAPDTPQ